jgi:hypothetical protein
VYRIDRQLNERERERKRGGEREIEKNHKLGSELNPGRQLKTKTKSMANNIYLNVQVTYPRCARISRYVYLVFQHTKYQPARQ